MQQAYKWLEPKLFRTLEGSLMLPFILSLCLLSPSSAPTHTQHYGIPSVNKNSWGKVEEKLFHHLRDKVFTCATKITKRQKRENVTIKWTNQKCSLGLRTQNGLWGLGSQNEQKQTHSALYQGGLQSNVGDKHEPTNHQMYTCKCDKSQAVKQGMPGDVCQKNLTPFGNEGKLSIGQNMEWGWLKTEV